VIVLILADERMIAIQAMKLRATSTNFLGIPFVELREGAGSRDVPFNDEPGSGGDRRISINHAPAEPAT
jgi:hypothetical protein